MLLDNLGITSHETSIVVPAAQNITDNTVTDDCLYHSTGSSMMCTCSKSVLQAIGYWKLYSQRNTTVVPPRGVTPISVFLDHMGTLLRTPVSAVFLHACDFTRHCKVTMTVTHFSWPKQIHAVRCVQAKHPPDYPPVQLDVACAFLLSPAAIENKSLFHVRM